MSGDRPRSIVDGRATNRKYKKIETKAKLIHSFLFDIEDVRCRSFLRLIGFWRHIS